VNLEEPEQSDIYTVGTISHVKQMLKLPNGTIRVLVEGVQRAQIKSFTRSEPFFEVELIPLEEDSVADAETSALMRTVLSQFEYYLSLSKKVAPEVLASVSDIQEPGRLADVIASHLNLKIRDKQDILEKIDVRERLERM
jgi:ATP-dependent Lon protease